MKAVLWCVTAILAGPALAQQTDPLRGPNVPEQAVRTIVRHDVKGNFLPVEGRPENAAVSALGLDAEALEKARDQVMQRAVKLNIFLIDRIDEVKDITDATQKGDRKRAQELLKSLQEQFDHGTPRDPAAADLTLTPEQTAELKRLLDEYWGTWIDWEMRRARDRSPAARQAKQDELAFRLFQREVQEAYDRTLKPYRDRIETLYAALEPTEEQKAAIREAVIEYIRTARLSPTQQQREDLVKKIYGLLDEQRRAKLFALIVNQWASQR